MPKHHPITGCRADAIFGLWFMDAIHLEQVVHQASSFNLQELMKINAEAQEKDKADTEPKVAYVVDSNGIGKMEMTGTITKHPTSFGNVMDCSVMTTAIQTLELMMNDPKVKCASLHIDGSPGGTVAGSAEMVDALRAFDAVKPLYVHISDLGASLAFLIASQGRRITANRNAEIGSIGTLTLLRDTSGMYKAEGVKVYAIGSGTMKGAGAAGTPITEDQLKYFKNRIMKMNELFTDAVMWGRNFDEKKMKTFSDTAEVYGAKQAKELGLIDDIMSYSDHLKWVASQTTHPVATRGTPGSVSKPTATRSSHMPLTAAQIEAAKQLPGASAISADTADQILLGVADSLNKQVSDLQGKIPKQVDPSILKGHATLALGNIDLCLAQGKIIQVQADVLKDAIMKDDKVVNPELITPMSNGKMPYQVMLQVLENNKPSGLTDVKTGSQPAPRTEPGEKQDDLTAHRNAAQAHTNRIYGGGNGVATK